MKKKIEDTEEEELLDSPISKEQKDIIQAKESLSLQKKHLKNKVKTCLVKKT